MVIKEGNKVKVKQFEGNPYGVVKDVYHIDPHDSILIVQLENEDIIKCHAHEVVLIREEPKTDTITLTREEFQNLAIKVTNPTCYSKDVKDPTTALMVGLTGVLICKNLEEELFGDD